MLEMSQRKEVGISQSLGGPFWPVLPYWYDVLPVVLPGLLSIAFVNFALKKKLLVNCGPRVANEASEIGAR